MAITIEKAIKDLQSRVNRLYHIQTGDKCEDMLLGLEALKDKQQSRGALRPGFYILLPAETEESGG